MRFIWTAHIFLACCGDSILNEKVKLINRFKVLYCIDNVGFRDINYGWLTIIIMMWLISRQVIYWEVSTPLLHDYSTSL